MTIVCICLFKLYKANYNTRKEQYNIWSGNGDKYILVAKCVGFKCRNL